MNTDMRFGDDDHAGNTLGAELVKCVSDNRRANTSRCVYERGFNNLQIIKCIGITIAEFHQHMRP